MNTKKGPMFDKEANRLQISLQKHLSENHRLMNCLNCIFFKSGPGPYDNICEKFNSIPPPMIIVNGCEEHDFDIPF